MTPVLTPFSRQKTGSYDTFYTKPLLCDSMNQVRNMIHNAAARLAKASCERGWIDEENYEWCIYALEKRISVLLYIAVVLLWAGISGLLIEALSFLLPFYLIRRRIGGCHARSAGACFTLSILLVVFISLFVADISAYLPQVILILADAAAVITGLLIKPVYPPQAHFTSAEQLANNRRKNILLCTILLAQCISLCVHDLRIFTGSFCGVLFAVSTAVIQIKKNKRENLS